MRFSFRLAASAIALVINLSGCASTTTRSFVSAKKENWGEYHRCSTAGFFRNYDGIQAIVFAEEFHTSDDLDNVPTLTWAFKTSGELRIDFTDPQAQVEFRVYPAATSFKKNIRFTVEQTMNTKHPEIPSGMTTKYDYGRGVVTYGIEKRLWWGIGPESFEVRGELKSPRFHERFESGHAINGAPDRGYDRDQMYEAFSLAELKGKTKQIDSIVVLLPSYELNGKPVAAEKLKFEYSNHVRNSTGINCAFTKSSYPRWLDTFLYYINPWDN